MPELGSYGSVRGVSGNGHPYRDHSKWEPGRGLDLARASIALRCCLLTDFSSFAPSEADGYASVNRGGFGRRRRRVAPRSSRSLGSPRRAGRTTPSRPSRRRQ